MTGLLVCFGFGYCAEALACRLDPRHWRIIGTSRTEDGAKTISAKGFEGLVFDGQSVSPELESAISEANQCLISTPPGTDGDPVLRTCGKLIGDAPQLDRLAYLSTVGVYGDTGGTWVDEDTPPRPTHERSIRRLEAERGWLSLGSAAVHGSQIYRIAGIYGPGRNPLLNLRDGTAQRIVKPGQVFNRIHVADIAQALEAGIERGQPGRVYNLTDDEPAAPDAVIAYAADLLGIAPPEAVAFQDAKLSPMAASFYGDNRRVRNSRLRQELGVDLLYPTYREGLTALAKEIKGR